MSKTRDTFLSIRRKRIIIIVFAFVLYNLVSYIIDPFSAYWKIYFQRDAFDIFLDLFLNFSFCCFISESSIYLGMQLNHYIPWTKSPYRRLLIETGLNFILVMLAIGFFDFLYRFLEMCEACQNVTSSMSIEMQRGYIQWIVVSVIISFMIIGINTCVYLIDNWKNSEIRAAALDQMAVEAELYSLKLQIDPHFVFNNLSVLSEMILKDQQLGYEYAENFSRIYRYMLVNTKKDVISLDEELRFLKSYIFLIKQRIGDGVTFEVDIEKECLGAFLPPLTLQLLVENALKHNKTTRRNPLQICIYNTDKNELIVENNLLPIENPMSSSGLGLQNIQRRYKLLWQKGLEIDKSTDIFKVIIPLIRA
ncbi:sensor histidine kinase [Flectobacillus roseus]|uniref:sensor histidine kinase n=1 Tax=Flectobacillus roseus TaxID=502259 RepID=UPI0024B6857D|nr:histidine kinase [Flectobacillus roseus]MDI9868986.1 histidine kinase [Flectobacillus roseus]